MAKNKSRTAARLRRHRRVRKKVTGTSESPRLNVFRSLNEIYAQVINDEVGHTVASASSTDGEIRAKKAGLTKIEQAKLVGQIVAERAKAAGVEQVVFDRGGYRYTGRVRALADGARESGLQF
jgi:large subunit ribosomal protein L18